jgi:hypothetical protein
VCASVHAPHITTHTASPMPPLWQVFSLGAAIGGPAAAGWAFFGAALGDGDDAGDGVAQVCQWMRRAPMAPSVWGS